MVKVKITVVKKIDNRDIFGDEPPLEFTTPPQCDALEVGQEFICGISCPQGFCSWAYADIQRDIIHLLFGGNFPWMKEEGTILSCCTDGVRPVIFKLERVEE